MSLPYELEVFDELITETIHPKNLIYENAVTMSKQCAAWEKKGRSQLTKARKRLKPVAYSFLKVKHKRLYICQHQSAIIHLFDLLFHYLFPVDYNELSEKESDTKIVKLYKRLLGQCNSFLQYIKETFPHYWDQDHKIPDAELMRLQKDLLPRLSIIKRKLSRIKADKKLVRPLIALLEPFSDKVNEIRLTYHELAYINELVSNLETLRTEAGENNFCHPLNTLIIYLNVNKTVFKDYLSDCICTDVNTVTTVKEKLDKLFFYFKRINQMHTKPGVALLPGARSVKDEIKDWLAGEIKYLQETQSLGMIVPGRFKNDIEYKKGIWCTYTIEEIALLYRLQYEAKFITNKKVRPMIADLSKFIHTDTVHNISAKSLYNSFYKIDFSTVQSLNDKLFMLISQLRKIESNIKRKSKEKHTLRK